MAAREPVVRGLNGIGRIAFETKVRHGVGQRTVEVCVRPEVITSIAICLQFTGFDLAPDGSKHWHVGHAVWHLQSPDVEMPCSMCKPVPPSETPAPRELP